MADVVAVSIGGSFLVGKDGVDLDLARQIAGVLDRVSQSRRVIAVVGGGATARRYITAARELGADEASLDDIGIAVTRINARVLIAALHDAYPAPARSLDEAAQAIRQYPVVVMGGTHPGHTTDAVAAMVAEKARAFRLVIATNVSHVYDKDPNRHEDAKRLERLSAAELVDITIRSESKAGGAGVVDSLGAKIIQRTGAECAVVHGRDLKALEAALLGETTFEGSLVAGREKS